MKNVLLQKAIKLTKEYRRKRYWQAFVKVTAALVVFCTTYALILPAITMERETVCGWEAHVHTEECYVQKPVLQLHCVLSVSPEDVILHGHQECCYDASGMLICQLAENIGHTHEETCYEPPKCICQIPEGDGHSHSEACMSEKVLTCGQEQTEGHVHSEACTPDRVLVCTIPASDGHIHDVSCSGTEQVLICGTAESPAHVHSEACSYTESKLVCMLDMSEEHTHTDACYELQVISCSQEETEGHTHEDGCYETRTVPCTLEESHGHVHSENCYGPATISCEIPETEAHTHDETCYSVRSVSCPISEAPAHVHADSCYEKQGALKCTLEECRPHNHEEHCYDSKGNKICQLPTIVSHTHGEACVTDTGETVSVLVCAKEEHVHEEACFVSEDVDALEYLCNIGEHSHSDDCYNEQSVLSCTIPEHIHEVSCVVADVDLTADVETPEQWESVLRDVSLEGQWPQDLLAVARTQLGYQESSRNCILSEKTIKGYTRYGAKYGTPYDDWDTLFVSFCLEYAAVKDFPTHLDRSRWMELLEEEDLLRNPEIYLPKPGDLVFLDQDQKTDAPVDIPVEADLVGIFAEYLPETAEEPARLKMIAGDVENKVDYIICETGDPVVIGYGELPQSAVVVQEPDEQQPVARQLEYAGPDYTVTVTFGPEALLPENAVLDVREIVPGTDEYLFYYQQSIATLCGDAEATPLDETADAELQMTEETDQDTAPELEVTFARFFDIHFVSDGTALEPAAPVDIQIQYIQGIELPDEQESVAVHFADSGIELLETDTSRNQDYQVDGFAFTQNSFSVSGTVVYAAPRTIDGFNVWLDGTCGGHRAYTGAKNEAVTATNPYTLPTTFDSPNTYRYKLNGWYDVTNGQYYAPGAEVEIKGDTVFYADWVAETYDIGEGNRYAVQTENTSEFITIDVFDYNVLFNTQSSVLNTGRSEINADDHTEVWDHIVSGDDTLNFSFVDANSESTNRLANTNGRNNTWNVYTGGKTVYQGIMPQDLNAEGADLRRMNALFRKDTAVPGKHYLGSGNFLFQYDAEPTSEYFGYYYYDSAKNAASYHQTDKRFYVYKYLEKASSSDSSAFLPLNSPYANNPSGKNPSGDPQSGYAYNTTSDNNLTTDNFFFGMRTNIHFYLPNDVGALDKYDNPGNLDTNGKPMVFKFSGDDDVWVYVDDVLVLDIGGIHQANSGTINFSSGEVILDGQTSQLNDLYPAGVLKEGGHNLTIYYLERGCGESNCSIYFNLAPRYGLTLKKQDYHTRENLNDVPFGVYLDEACTVNAVLWPTHDEAKKDPNHDHSQNIFETQNGYLHFFGLVAGKTYYIKELSPPDGYRATNDLLRVTLNNHGADISEVTVLGGEDGRTQGYELVSHHLDEVNQVINLVVTNQRETGAGDKTKQVRVTKDWVLADENPAEVPDTITVHLTKDGERYGHSMTLGAHNGWAYTWTGLPDDGSEYDVLEDQVPGFELLPPVSTFAVGEIEHTYETHWLDVGALEDGSGYLLKTSAGYLAQVDGKLQIVSVQTDADNELQPPENAIWTSEAVEEGFRLSNGGYALTLGNNTFVTGAAGSGNQTLYYDGQGLFARQGGRLYYLVVSGNSITAGSAAYSIGLVKQELIPIDVHHIPLINTQLEDEKTTFLNVEKIWNTDNSVWDREVTIHLLKDGEDSGIAMILNQDCEWKGTFAGLPISDSEGNLYSYSVREASVDGYEADYSEVTKVPGGEKNVWETVTTLVPGETYVFVSNNRALTASGNSLTSSALSDVQNPADSQKWIYTSNHKLQNVSNSRYLQLSTRYGASLTTTNNSNSASTVSLVSNQLQISSGNTNRYLQLSNSISLGRYSGTTLSVYQLNKRITTDGYQVTVTNTPFVYYTLPDTGGSGTMGYSLMGLVLMGIALIALLDSRRKGGCFTK